MKITKKYLQKIIEEEVKSSIGVFSERKVNINITKTLINEGTADDIRKDEWERDVDDCARGGICRLNPDLERDGEKFMHAVVARKQDLKIMSGDMGANYEKGAMASQGKRAIENLFQEIVGQEAGAPFGAGEGVDEFWGDYDVVGPEDIPNQGALGGFSITLKADGEWTKQEIAARRVELLDSKVVKSLFTLFMPRKRVALGGPAQLDTYKKYHAFAMQGGSAWMSPDKALRVSSPDLEFRFYWSKEIASGGNGGAAFADLLGRRRARALAHPFGRPDPKKVTKTDSEKKRDAELAKRGKRGKE